MVKWLLLGSLFLVPSLALAVDTITIDYGGTPEVLSIPSARKALRTKLLARLNLRRASQTPPLPPISLEKFEAQEIVNMLQQADREAATLSTAGDADFCTVFNDIGRTTNAQRNQIITIGGGASPCAQ